MRKITETRENIFYDGFGELNRIEGFIVDEQYQRYLEEALSMYDFRQPEVTFIRHNENITYKITDCGKQYLLRIQKPISGYNLTVLSDTYEKGHFIFSELSLLEFLDKKGILVQKPYKNKQNEWLSVLNDGTGVTVLEWIEGKPLSECGITEETARNIGTLIAKMHKSFKDVAIHPDGSFNLGTPSVSQSRYRYTQSIIVSIEKELKRAEVEGNVDESHSDILRQACRKIKMRMDELSEIPGSITLVHADLSPSNLILTVDQRIAPIDFSLSGIGFSWMDIGMTMASIPDKTIRRILKDAYEKEIGMMVPECFIETFFALGVMLYISCQHDKIHRSHDGEISMNRWCKTIFLPLIEDKSFVLVD